MDTTRFDAVARLFDNRQTRRGTLRMFLAGAVAQTASATLVAADDAAARKRKKNKKKSKKTTEQPLPPNPCEEKNWCLDRSQTCGPEGGYGKCLVEATGGNICAEILFQARSCTECEAPNCTNCRCALAAGGGDRCNNGANGYDFTCVRIV